MIKVLIVDDSAVVRNVLTSELSKYPDIEVVGTATDAYVARDKIVRLEPDVLTLDLEMPRMDGLSFLSKLMKFQPMPVVIVSSLTQANSDNAIRALELGAVEVISKPGSTTSTPDVSHQLVHAIRAAARSRPMGKNAMPKAGETQQVSQDVCPGSEHRLLAIGASTGGTVAVESILAQLPGAQAGTLIVQHMPERFTEAFADRLDATCQMEVREAQHGDRLVPGVGLVAPGNRHMMLKKGSDGYRVEIKIGPRVHHQRPSVDVLFHSVASAAGRNALGVLLTGMGADGAKGLLAMRKVGAHTIAQDERSSVVFGMPKEAIRIGAADEVLGLDRIPQAILDSLASKKVASTK